MNERRFAFIAGQAFSLSNFRGPLIREMVTRGWSVYAIAPDYDAETRAAVLALGAEPVDCAFSRTGFTPVGDFGALLRLVRLLRRLKIDAMLAYSIKPVIYGLAAAWIAGVPRRFAMIPGLGYVFAAPEDGNGTSGRRALRLLTSRLYRFSLARADKVFFQNGDDIEDLVRENIVERERTRNTNGTGVDLDIWTPAAHVVAPVTFMLAARLIREKGIVEYVEAARRIKARDPRVRFLLLGGIDSNPAAIGEDEVSGWVREGLVEWPGHVPVKPWIEMTSVYVLPSYYREGVPRSTQEAMAMGRAVITTDSVGCRETVIDGETGFLVPVRDVDALERAMRRFIDDPSLIERMGSASRRLAEQRFDIRRVNALMLSEMGIDAQPDRVAAA